MRWAGKLAVGKTLRAESLWWVMKPADRLLSLAGALLLAGYYVALVWPGFRVYFSPDDTMNLYKPWSLPLRELILANLLFFRSSAIFRPLASAWYATIFHFAGFNPRPFHIAYTAIFLLNIFWTYSVARRLSGSREAGAATALLGSYYHALTTLFLDTAYVYDALCYSFYFATLLLYLQARDRGRQLTSWELAGCCLLYICALNSKEMAVTLPLTFLVYELIYHPPARWREISLPRARPILATGIITVVFVIGRSVGAESLLKMSAYRPHFTVTRFLATSRNFFDDTFFHVTNYSLLTIWAALFAIAWLSGSRVLRFAWLFLMLSPLPVAFIDPRGPAQYYIPWFGWVLFAGAAVVELLQRLTQEMQLTPEMLSRVRGCALIAILACILYPYYKSLGWTNAASVALEAPAIRETVAEIHNLHPQFPPHSRLLFRHDPFPPDWWTLTFLIKESYRDDSLQVSRVKQQGAPADPSQPYDFVFDYQGGRYFDSQSSAPLTPVPFIVSSAGSPEIYHSGWRLVTPAAPAKAGEVVIAKATCLGFTIPMVPADKPFPAQPLLPVSSPVEVRVDGELTEVTLKIGWPETINQYRIDFRVPKPRARGSAFVQITAAGITGPLVSMPVE
jgi:hypothetical protein